MAKQQFISAKAQPTYWWFQFLRLLCFVIIFTLTQNAGATENKVRVLIIESSHLITISGNSLTGSLDGKKSPLSGHIEISRKGQKLFLNKGGKRRALSSIHIQSRSGVININGTDYRGTVEAWPSTGAGIAVVNIVGFDDYLASVLGSEMDSEWPLEALRAQAVVARTYALAKKRRPKIQVIPNYDLKATVMDQVYKGTASEAPSTRQATHDTSGQVLLYNGEVAQVYYHSTCGGRTLSSSEVWGKDIPYLRGVECGFCEDSPRYFWSHTATLSDLRTRLERAGYRLDKLTGIKADTTSTLDPVNSVQCIGRPRPITTSGANLRKIVGYSHIFSTRFIIREEKESKSVTFLGSGAGHGVGLCQWGARGMAAEGIDYRAIVYKYFPGTDIENLY